MRLIKIILSKEFTNDDRTLSLDIDEQGTARLSMTTSTMGMNILSLYLTSEWSYINWLVGNQADLLHLRTEARDYWFDSHVQRSAVELKEEFNSTIERLDDIITNSF